MKKKLQDKLEEIKMQGNYAVNLFYGGDIGSDDLDVPQEERNVKVVYTPIGYLAGIRVLFKGSLDSLLKCDFKIRIPKQISNPPKIEEYKKSGLYVWGNEDSVKDYLSSLKKKK